MVLTTRKLRKIIRQAIVETTTEHADMTPEEENEYYDQLAAEYEELEDGRYEREDAMYRKMGESVRRLVRESDDTSALEAVAQEWLDDYDYSIHGDLIDYKDDYLMDRRVRRHKQYVASQVWDKLRKEMGLF